MTLNSYTLGQLLLVQNEIKVRFILTTFIVVFSKRYNFEKTTLCGTF